MSSNSRLEGSIDPSEVSAGVEPEDDPDTVLNRLYYRVACVSTTMERDFLNNLIIDQEIRKAQREAGQQGRNDV